MGLSLKISFIAWGLGLSLMIFALMIALIIGIPVSFMNWDSGHFVRIAQTGYLRDFDSAFLPLYPYLLSLGKNFNIQIWGVGLNLVLSFLAVWLLAKLLLLDFDKKI